jgi:CcmD family protein
MTAEEKYVAAAYLVVFLAVLVYVLIIAAKLSRLERDVAELARLAQARKTPPPRAPEPEPEEAHVG